MPHNESSVTDLYDFAVLRDLRRSRDLTIADVSEACGVSAPVISRIERNLSQAELDTLFRLARVFGLTAADLLALAERRTAHVTRSFRYTSGGFRFDSVQYGNVKCFHGKADRGDVISHPEMHKDEYELCWVLRGRLRISLPNETHDLKTGDALQFDAILEHAYEALDNVDVMILHITKQKRF